MKKILITGASSGIGLATAKLCIEKGYTVIALARDFSKLSLKTPLFIPYSLDLTQNQFFKTHIDEIKKSHPDIDSFVFSAGKGLFGNLEQLSTDQIEELVSINFLSQVKLTQAFLPDCKKRKSGTFIYLGSEAALTGKAQGSIYCASKFALRGFTQALRKECLKSNVRISLINPGMVKTPFFDRLHFSPKNEESYYCQPNEVADCILMQIEARPSLVFDEINLSPLKNQAVTKTAAQLKTAHRGT